MPVQQMLDDKQWEKIKTFLPKRERSKKGGRPPAEDRACLEGILWGLKTGARWRDLPPEFPSPSTCWRRFVFWEQEGVLDEIVASFLETLDKQGVIDWNEVFIDATFAPSKKGGNTLAPPKKEKEQSWFWWRMARAFRWGLSLIELAQQRASLRKKRSKK